MSDLKEKLKSKPLLYIARDLEKAMGLPLDTEGYHVVTNSTRYARSTADNIDSVHLINKDQQLDTRELLKTKKVKNVIQSLNPNILVFKNTKQIERKCRRNDWDLLNPPSEIINRVEQKISQLKWLNNLKTYLPEHEIKKCKNISWKGEKFILQFNRSHSGEGTHLIKNSEELKQIKEKFPKRPARISKYIKGNVFTLNCVAAENKVLFGSISYQITGRKPFTDNRFTTIGNDWGVVKETLNQQDKQTIKRIAKEVGGKLKNDGFIGLFGIDIIKSNKDDIYLIEINARQPASTTFESQLQQEGLTTFKAHISSLLKMGIEKNITPVKNGAQIIYRKQRGKNLNTEEAFEKLKSQNFEVIVYENEQHNSEIMRVMTEKKLINPEYGLSGTGRKVVDIIKSCSSKT